MTTIILYGRHLEHNTYPGSNFDHWGSINLTLSNNVARTLCTISNFILTLYKSIKTLNNFITFSRHRIDKFSIENMKKKGIQIKTMR